MKCKLKKIIICIALFIVLLPATAQQIKTVSGYVMNANEGRKAVPFKEQVTILAFNNLIMAKDALKLLNNEQHKKELLPDDEAIAEKDGYYSIKVSTAGALIFNVNMTHTLIEVNGRAEINANIEGNIEIDVVNIYNEYSKPGVIVGTGRLNGNNLALKFEVPVPRGYKKPNARLILSPYVVDCSPPHDTVGYLRPIVINGGEFTITQDRRFSFDITRDPLHEFTRQTVLDKNLIGNIRWKDTIRVENTQHSYESRIHLLFEDYLGATYELDSQSSPCEMQRPMQFLDYPIEYMSLNPNEYKPMARREKRNTSGNVSLTFLVGKVILDPDDTENETQMEKLRADLMTIVNGEGTTLREVEIMGVASPEGRYQANLALAQKRTVYALSQVTSNLPSSARKYLSPLTQARVATWGEVADLLKQDSLKDKAEEIRNIEKKYPKSPDAQFAQISRLPYYKSDIVPVLPKLRTVHYEYRYDISRELNPEEIMERYEHDLDYKSGKKSFTLYEYWHLFQLVKDKRELENLYRRAYNDSKSANPKPWLLAANNLAIAYMQRDTCDTTLLEPFITYGVHNVNKKGVDENEIVNPEAVILNQLAMYIKSGNYEQASVVSQLLPKDEERFKTIKAFTMCMGGYYAPTDNMDESMQKECIAWFNLVKESSPQNKVVLYLAMDTPTYNSLAQEAVAKMPQDKAITYYLKAVIAKRLKTPNDWGTAEEDYLLEAFKRDSKLIMTAANDGDIGKELYDIVMEKYEKEKQQ